MKHPELEPGGKLYFDYVIGRTMAGKGRRVIAWWLGGMAGGIASGIAAGSLMGWGADSGWIIFAACSVIGFGMAYYTEFHMIDRMLDRHFEASIAWRTPLDRAAHRMVRDSIRSGALGERLHGVHDPAERKRIISLEYDRVIESLEGDSDSRPARPSGAAGIPVPGRNWMAIMDDYFFTGEPRPA